MRRAAWLAVALVALIACDKKKEAPAPGLPPASSIAIEKPPPDPPVPAPFGGQNVVDGCRADLERMAKSGLAFGDDWTQLSDGELVGELENRLWRTYLEWGEGDDFAFALAGAKHLGNPKLAALLSRAKALFGGTVPEDSDERTEVMRDRKLGDALDAIDDDYRALHVDAWLAAEARKAAAAGTLTIGNGGGVGADPHADALVYGLSDVRDAIATDDAVYVLHDDRCSDRTRVVRVAYAGGAVQSIDERAKSPAIDHLVAVAGGVAWFDGATIRFAPRGGAARPIAHLGGGAKPASMWSCPDSTLVVDATTGAVQIDTNGVIKGGAACSPGNHAPPDATRVVVPKRPERVFESYDSGHVCALVREDGELGTFAVFCAGR